VIVERRILCDEHIDVGNRDEDSRAAVACDFGNRQLIEIA